MTIKLPVELFTTVLLPETVTVVDILDFLDSTGIESGLGEAAFYTLTAEVRGLRGDAARQARREGHPTRDDLSKIGDDTFNEGFQITGPSAFVAVQSAAQYARAIGDWDPKGDQPQPTGWRVALYGSLTFSPVTDKDFPKAQHPEIFEQNFDRCIAFARAALSALPAQSAVVQRKDTATHCPRVPLVQFDYALFAAKPETIAEDYADTDAFAAAWDASETLGNGLTMFTRGTDIQDQDAFWLHAVEPQLQLARAAKPGKVRYPAPRLPPARREQIADRARYLEQVGYNADAETLEFTAYVPDNQHLGVRDIYELAGLKRDGLPNGDPLKDLIVTFANEGMAKREARPLFDMGIIVQYFGSDGAFHALQPQ